MNNTLITGAEHHQMHFLERWLPHESFIWGTRQYLSHLKDESQVLIPQVTHPNFVHAVLNICLDKGISQIYPTAKAEQVLLNEALILFSEFDIQVYCPTTLTHQLLQNPGELLNRFKDEDIDTVPYLLATDFKQFSEACVQLGYPNNNVSFTGLNGKQPVYFMGEHSSSLSCDEFRVSFVQAAQLLNRDINSTLLLRKRGDVVANHRLCYHKGVLMSSWLDVPVDEKLAIEAIGKILNLHGIYQIELHNNHFIYQISTLISDDLF